MLTQKMSTLTTINYNFFMNIYKKAKIFLFYIFIYKYIHSTGCVVVIPYAGDAGDAGAR